MEQHEIVKEFIKMQEKFLTLQSDVAKELKNECEAVKRSWYSHTLFINIWNAVTTYLVIILLFSLVPLAWKVFIAMFGKYLLLDYKYFIFGLIVILFLFGRPSSILFRYLIKNHPRMKALIRLLDSIVIPLEIGVIHEGLDYLLKNKFLNHIYNDFFFILFLSAFTAFAITASSSLIPDFLILLASNRININPREKSFSYESITKKVVEDTYVNVQLWSISEVQKVRIYSQKRSAHLSAQIQTIAPALGAISLFSLVALIFTSEQTQNIVKFFSGLLKLITETSSERNLNILIIAGIALFAIGSCTYFVNLYKSLCVLEIMDTLCLIRIEECEKEEKNVEEYSSSSQSLSIPQICMAILENYFRKI
jgi:hypothetical protein